VLRLKIVAMNFLDPSLLDRFDFCVTSILGDPLSLGLKVRKRKNQNIFMLTKNQRCDAYLWKPICLKNVGRY